LVRKDKQYGLVGQEQDAAMLPFMTQKIKNPFLGATKHFETGLPTLHMNVNQVFSNLAFGKKYLNNAIRIKVNGARS
jgi:hypothetical protein